VKFEIIIAMFYLQIYGFKFIDQLKWGWIYGATREIHFNERTQARTIMTGPALDHPIPVVIDMKLI